jgi:hypothetical protein
MNNLSKAINLLKTKCKVVPEKYAMYNGAFMFLAYPPNIRDKSRCINAYYLVDLKNKAAGPFSPAFDLDGFFKAAETMRPC